MLCPADVMRLWAAMAEKEMEYHAAQVYDGMHILIVRALEEGTVILA